MDDEINPPPLPPVLFRQARFFGNPQQDQVAEERNELVRGVMERIQEEQLQAQDHELQGYQALQNLVANFNRGENRRLDIDGFRQRLEVQIQQVCEQHNIDFDPQLDHDVPMP